MTPTADSPPQIVDDSLPVDVLWTGGWDSTYRVLSLLHAGRTVRPHYVESLGRVSIPEERAAIAAVAAGVRTRGWGDRLLPLAVLSAADLEPDAQADARLAELRGRQVCGRQYEYLARYALQRLGGRPLDLSVHLDDKAELIVRPHVTAGRDGYVLAEVSDDAVRLFEPFRFPLLDLTKPDMRARAEAAGFQDLMELTWFCHKPRRIFGRSAPCGDCSPCRWTHEEGMGHRLPLLARVRRAAPAPLRRVLRAARFHTGAARQRATQLVKGRAASGQA